MTGYVTTAITGMRTPRFPALLDACVKEEKRKIKIHLPTLQFSSFLFCFVFFVTKCTFNAGPLSEARSLARFPSRPSWTNSSKRFTISSSTSCSPCRFAAMLASAFITAREQCLTEAKRRDGNIRSGVNVDQGVSVRPNQLTCSRDLCSPWWLSRPPSWPSR